MFAGYLAIALIAVAAYLGTAKWNQSTRIMISIGVFLIPAILFTLFLAHIHDQ